jgi:geranylgeranyl reductase family protein
VHYDRPATAVPFCPSASLLDTPGSWDVVIAGAGPAGSIAALHLARQGHRVLLVDKADFPRDKVCGDALIADALRCLERAGLSEAVSAAAFETHTTSIYSPSQIRCDVQGRFLTLKRFVFDDMLVRAAVAAGASLARARVTRIVSATAGAVQLRIAGRNAPLRSRLALVATGADVTLASQLHVVSRAQPSALALRCYARSRYALDRLILSFDRTILPGYAWIFPLPDGELNVGCGITLAGQRRVNLRATFERFVRAQPEARELLAQASTVGPLRGAPLRIGLEGLGARVAGGVLFVGEVLGTTFPFSGEGIGKAMETGELAAQICGDALQSGEYDRLASFDARIQRELKPRYRGYEVAQAWFSHGWLTDFMARRIRASRWLRDAVAGLVNETVDPREIFSLRGVLRSFMR